MQEFTGKEYVMIDIANQMGHDKLTWDKRIQWTLDHEKTLEALTDEASSKYLYIKAVNALRDAQAGIPTGYMLGLDATASGLQIDAMLGGCRYTAMETNLINTGKREDVYLSIGTQMGISRDKIKDPLMTVFYGSTKQPEKAFGENTDMLKKFYETLFLKLPGAMDVLKMIQSCWDPTAISYSWTMPDKHRVNMKVFGAVDRKIEVDELDHRTFTYRANINMPKTKGRSLCANVVHSVDAYIARELIRRCAKEKVQVAAIHDSFWTYPNEMNTVRKHFISIAAEIAESTLLQDILRELTGNNAIRVIKDSHTLGAEIRRSEYALS